MDRAVRRRLYRSARWLRLSAQLRRERGPRCEMCRRVGDLEVHHLDYRRFFDPAYLRVLCRGCHFRVHRGAKLRAAKQAARRGWEAANAGWRAAVAEVTGSGGGLPAGERR